MNKLILKELNILYAEDEDDVRNFTTKTLESLVKSITSVVNGKDGYEAFKNDPEKFNLIITDINMPKMNGLDMCANIKEINQDIPIVVTSAYNDESFLKRSIEVGVSSYTMKPIDLYQLIESIVKAAEPQYLRRELEKTREEKKTKSDDISTSILKNILDSQENIIMVYTHEKLDMVNKKFLDFFDVYTNEEFTSKHTSIEKLFLKEEGLFYPDHDDDTNWVEQIKSLNEINRIVKLKDKENNYKTFIVNVDNYEFDGDRYVVSLTDITQIREKSALLEYQANHDPLTGLSNRTAFYKVYNAELKRDIRYNHSLSLILFDIDNFKMINDNYGHNIGDIALKQIAELTLKNVREHDTVTRWGGEEFIVLLPETDVDGAIQVAEKIRVAIERFEDKHIPKFTSSFGVSQLQYEDNHESFIQRVDEALYKAKRTGKNKVVSK